MRRSRMIGAVVVATTLAATVWGLSVSVLASAPDTGSPPPKTPGRGSEELVLFARWGSGPGEAGRTTGGELRGPASFAVDDRRRIWLLDQENQRLVCYEHGRQLLESALPDSDCEDIVAERDRVCVLSQGDVRRIRVFDDRGALVATVAVPQELPPILRMAIDGGRILLECPDEHGREYYDAGPAAAPVRPPSKMKRLKRRSVRLPDGRTASARLASGSEVCVELDGDAGRAIRLRPRANGDVRAVLDLAGDLRGGLYLSTIHGDMTDDEAPASLSVRRFDREGELTAAAWCSYAPLTDSTRRVVVTPSGEVYRMDSDTRGVSIVRWHLEPARGGEPR